MATEGLQGPSPWHWFVGLPIDMHMGPAVVIPDESMNDFIDCGRAFVSHYNVPVTIVPMIADIGKGTGRSDNKCNAKSGN